ncbi:DUF3180 domain-containing protein [Pseudarthrobacter sp. J1738]|uniref:DUF3180 domain-containing protein n=1 Tax=Pseudarthrobacter sp. J1738 TaxID=3420446 RepID=UPI003D2B4010
MKSIRPIVLVAIAGALAVVAWVVSLMAAKYSFSTPLLPLSALITVGVIAALTLILGLRILRWKNNPSKTRLDPILAARTLLLAQAAAYAGAVLFGWHAGIVLDQLRFLAYSSGQANVWSGLIMAGGGLVMVAVGLVVERFCRVPPEDDTPSGGGDASSSGRVPKPKNEGEYASRAD